VQKPICETHRVNELLDRFSGSKAIWIFRNYQGAANSAAVKWRSGRENLRRLAERNLEAASWRAGGLTTDKFDVVKRLYRRDISLYEAEALMWYLRNGLFFDLHACERPDVLLVRYEDLVSDPGSRFADVFEFIGTSMPARCVEAINGSAGPRRSDPEIHPEIRTLCDGLHERLLAHYREKSTAAPFPSVARAGTARAS
jgi:hypothetical protein